MALNLTFEKIVLHNFGSYGHAEVNLLSRGFCLVTGKNNFKKDNAFSNGSGKSFLWSGICFALTGETINGLRTNLKNINIDEDECYASIQFRNNGDEFIVTRYIAPKSDLKISKNGIDVSGKGLRESEKKLGEILPELSKDLIASTIIIGQSMPNKLSSFSPSGRKELLERLTKSDFMIEDIKNRVNNRLSELDRQIRTAEDSLLVNKTQLASDKKRLDELKDEEAKKARPDFDVQLKVIDAKINEYQKYIDMVAKEIKGLEDALKETSDRLIAQTAEKGEWNKKLQEEYSVRYQPLLNEKAGYEANIRLKESEIAKLKSIKDKCPTCGRPFEGVVKPNTETQEKELTEAKKLLEDVKGRITELNVKTSANQKHLNEAYDGDIAKLRQEEAGLRKKINEYKDKINDYKRYQDLEKEAAFKIQYEKENWDKSRQNAAQAIRKLEESTSSLANAINITENDLANLQERQAVVRKMKTLTERDFRGHLLTNIIGYLDKKAKEYCKIVFGTEDLKVYLDGNALDISYCDKLIDCLSGGEKQRVDLILQLAIRDLLQTYLGFSSSILVLDEITDFLDAQACGAIMRLLSTVLNNVESVFIISHHSESLEIPIDTEIKIVKNADGISEII